MPDCFAADAMTPWASESITIAPAVLRMLWTLLLLATTAVGATSAWLYVAQDRMIYITSRTVAATPADAGLAFEEVDLLTGDGVRLHAWFIPAADPIATVLYAHGNAGNISHRLDTLAGLNRLGLDVFIFDYRGYGRSEGSPDEQGTYRDVRAAWDYLTDIRAVPANSIILFGRSLGGAIAAWLSSQVEHGALIVDSGFSSLPDVAADHYPWIPVRHLARSRYDTLSYVRETRSPVLIAHSRGDEIVPFTHGERIYEAAAQPKTFIELSGGHNTAFSGRGPAYIKGLQAFIDRHFCTPCPP